ncbi:MULTISPECIES: aminotransferase class V-fold PLP-dependent enzyme [Microbacterium]|uniref:aminotransferase class V-fold PLP-dependent enzyme n=1 Tax=Microbacterium TaxID=33882 RepID=UPI002781F4AC|nr:MULTISPECIES: aminotransferase class V-fold PLP-dependent enzyme [Microbacterium]MDQ1083944.1 selenocysteine lyase/cysteine desulfurase [Microbacterium sp. SORGH_AS_0344]MDQ1170777.1 selenocysteine lyase/cysteine desulfurase [Microbacterium proteolyticum]
MSSLALHFAGGRDYLGACTVGLPARSTVRAIRADLDAAASGRPDLAAASRAVEEARSAYARLVRSPVGDVAIGSQTSVMVSMIAASVPDGAEVLCPEDDFASLVAPFAQTGRGIRLRTVPLAELADAVSTDTWMVAFSLVQSATGEVADAAGIAAAAARAGARTLCDLTQAAGWLPVDATLFDATVCHAYKWLCCPRGVGFLTVRPDFAARLRPVQAGWYSGDDPWSSCYGTGGTLAANARRFDVSPAWQAFVGAAPALTLFADADAAELYVHTTALAARFRECLGLAQPARPSAIVTWPDATGEALAQLTAHGITASGRAGRARVAFHVFNDEIDVDRALRALGRGRRHAAPRAGRSRALDTSPRAFAPPSLALDYSI